MSIPVIKRLTLKEFIGTQRLADGSFKDLYKDLGKVTVELYMVDNSNDVKSDEYIDDVRRSNRTYIGIIRCYKLKWGKYTLSDNTECYTVNKANIAGNRTFLKLELVEGF